MNAVWFLVVAVLWGGTNPLLKKGSIGIENIKEDSKVKQFISELMFLFLNWKVRLFYLKIAFFAIRISIIKPKLRFQMSKYILSHHSCGFICTFVCYQIPLSCLICQ